MKELSVKREHRATCDEKQRRAGADGTRRSGLQVFNLGLLGFGNVGRALGRLLTEKRDRLREEFGIEWRVTGVAARRLGRLVAPEGFGMDGLASGDLHAPATEQAASLEEWLALSRCDVLFETTPLEPFTGEPAASYLRAALGHGAHVVTANKGPVVHACAELSALARERGRRFLFEATVADCLPVFSLFRESLPAARLLGFAAVLNSTTTLILEAMEAGASFDEGVRRAQALGVAEADPSHDVEGWDAVVKTCAVANVLMGARLKPGDVTRVGIRAVGEEEVRAAAAAGEPYRLVARARLEGGGTVSAAVRPERVRPADPLAVTGTTMAVAFNLDVLPALTIVARQTDLKSTAYAMLADFVSALRRR
jgi:homoserine dehydrogenase